jgi:hypothetical protein
MARESPVDLRREVACRRWDSGPPSRCSRRPRLREEPEEHAPLQPKISMKYYYLANLSVHHALLSSRFDAWCKLGIELKAIRRVAQHSFVSQLWGWLGPIQSLLPQSSAAVRRKKNAVQLRRVVVLEWVSPCLGRGFPGVNKVVGNTLSAWRMAPFVASTVVLTGDRWRIRAPFKAPRCVCRL